jgi:monomeric sarcosine oxidase
MKNWDLIVIGVGAVGSAALRAAGEVGARVLGIEQFEPANERGSSHGHSRIFRHAYFEHPDYVPLLRHSTARIESLERESGAALLHRCGMLVAGPGRSRAVQGSLEAARWWGLEVDEFDCASLATRFPWFDFPAGTIGAFEADAGLVRPEATLRAAVRVAIGHGAELRLGNRVRRITEDRSGVTVETDAGDERARSVIVAAGAWAGKLLPELAPRLTVTRQVQAWMTPRDDLDTATMPCWYYDRGPDRRSIYGLAADPLAGANVNDGSSVARGLKVGLHGSDDLVDPDVGAMPVTGADLQLLQDACREVAPMLTGDTVAASTCLYTVSPDENFLVGIRSGSRRVHFAAGLSGHGFKLGPALGDALVGLALHGRTALPIGFLSPQRFA